jgi:hypothetical protein
MKLNILKLTLSLLMVAMCLAPLARIAKADGYDDACNSVCIEAPVDPPYWCNGYCGYDGDAWYCTCAGAPTGCPSPTDNPCDGKPTCGSCDGGGGN